VAEAAGGLQLLPAKAAQKGLSLPLWFEGNGDHPGHKG
jgi:hypothetical protein